MIMAMAITFWLSLHHRGSQSCVENSMGFSMGILTQLTPWVMLSIVMMTTATAHIALVGTCL